MGVHLDEFKATQDIYVSVEATRSQWNSFKQKGENIMMV